MTIPADRNHPPAEISAATTVAAWLRSLADARGEHACVTAQSGSVSYAGLDHASREIARGLLAHGIGKGTRVGTLFGNGPQWVIWWAAIARIGAICVPLSTFVQPPELARVVRHADLHMLIAQPDFRARDFIEVITEAFPELRTHTDAELSVTEAPFLRTIVIPSGPTPSWGRGTDWITAAGSAPIWGQLLDRAHDELHPEEETLCIYTSGQSAEPKGVFFTHAALLAKADYLRDMFGFTTKAVTDVTLPFFWVGGLVMALFPTMAAGGTTHCTELSTWGSGTVIGSPGASTQSAAPPPSGMRAMPALGMTETFGMYSWGSQWATEDYPLAAPIDQLQNGFEIRLTDRNGADAAEGSTGEILLRGPTMTTRLQKSYRSRSFTGDGFYRTGDLAVRHGQRISFIGRSQDMIKTSGANVSPAEVERELCRIDGVDVAHVVALPDSDRGQLVAAAVVRVVGSTISADSLRATLRTRLSVYKVPRVIEFLDSRDEVPMTPSMKVRKPQLVELIQSRRSSPDPTAAGGSEPPV